MRAVVQRVSRAAVRVEGESVGAIECGLVVLLGVGTGDTDQDADTLAGRVANLRIFADAAGNMNLSVLETSGAALVISQFTLYGDARKGRRPSFIDAAPPEEANRLYERFCQALQALGLPVERGVFRAMMDVELVNQGPVTILLDSRKLF